jgi:hypothetical protein
MLYIVTVLSFLVIINTVYSAPDIQINSPANATYDNNKVFVNVTSNETVDFYITGVTKNIYLEKNTTDVQTSLFGKKGTYTFVIHASNSNGASVKNVTYSISEHNPVNISEGGVLMSSDTEYVLVNNITDDIAWGLPTHNITVNLNGFTIDSYSPISVSCSYSKVFNGTLNGFYGILLDFGMGCLFEDLTIHANELGVQLGVVRDVVFERINMTAPVAMLSVDHSAKLTIKDSNIQGDSGNSAFQHEFSGPDEYTLEHVNITNFAKDFSWLGTPYTPQYILRNSVLRIDESDQSLCGPARIYKQHLVIVNTIDENGNGVPVVVEITDNATIEGDVDFNINSNPTSSVFVATNESGIGSAWITEKVSIISIESPFDIEETVFSPYQITARTKTQNVTTTLYAFGNSTYNVPINLTFPTALPVCTKEQMLDLNNDEVINTKDALIILRTMVGKDVTINATKECNAISFWPVQG